MKQSLNFNWSFIPEFQNSYLDALPSKANKVNIPHTVKEVPYNYFSEETYQFVSTYEKIFDVDKLDKNRRYFIRFDAFMVKAKIYLNGHDFGEHISAYIPVEIEVTGYLKDKDNRLVVVLDSREDKECPPFGFVLDYLTFGGIYREVWLIDEPKTYLKDIFVHGSKDGDINVSFTKDGEDEISIKHSLYFEGNLLFSSYVNEFRLPNPKLWDINNPNLYELRTEISFGDSTQTYINRFGFRDAKFDNTGFYLNGKKIKLIGLNRHQGYPYIGYAATKSLQEDDALLLKNEVGVNVVRTSHYPQSEHFLNKCDEIGLLVINEIPGWQHIGESDAWRNQCFKNTEQMVITQRNHPCLIAHGVRIDESNDDKKLYLETNRIAHTLDPYRQTIGVRNFANSELLEDIYGFNDFSCGSMKIGLMNPKKVKTKGKALLITEYMGHMDPVKATSDLEKKLEVALRHAKVIDDNMKYENTAGAIGWCFVDYHTHKDFGSGDYICAHGVYDLYRNPKYTSYIYASQQDKFPVLKMLTNMKPGDLPAAIFGDIYLATNCDFVELFKNGEFVKRFYPNNDLFKYLKHPPILIDDIVAESFKEPRFKEKDGKRIAKMLSFAAMKGLGELSLSDKLFMAYCMLKYKVTYAELVGYWQKYVGTWGGEAKTFTFKGYKNGQVVKEIEAGPSISFDLEVKANKTELVNSDTYDMCRIRVNHVDNHGNICEYSAHNISVTTTGPIQLIGPSSQSLLGGQLSIYVKTTGESGKAKVKIKMDDIVKDVDLIIN